MTTSTIRTIARTQQKILASAGTRFYIFLCLVLLIIGIPGIASAEQVLANPKIKYDYDAVCDFVFARQYEAMNFVIEGAQRYKKKIKNFSDGNRRFDLSRYADENISIDYFLLPGGSLPKIVKISIKTPVAKYTKPNIAIRFGITGSLEQDLVLGCDASELKINFNDANVREINITNQF